MKTAETKSKVTFNGKMTTKVASQIIAKRKQFSLSRQALARILGITSATLLNWERRRCPRCQLRMINRIRMLISGGYDDLFARFLSGDSINKEDDNILQYYPEILLKVIRTYNLCVSMPKVQMKLLEDVSEAGRQALTEYTTYAEATLKADKS